MIDFIRKNRAISAVAAGLGVLCGSAVMVSFFGDVFSRSGCAVNTPTLTFVLWGFGALLLFFAVAFVGGSLIAGGCRAVLDLITETIRRRKDPDFRRRAEMRKQMYIDTHGVWYVRLWTHVKNYWWRYLLVVVALVGLVGFSYCVAYIAWLIGC